MAEQVFVVRRADFFGGAWPQGFSPLDLDSGGQLLSQLCARGFFADRAEAEENPAWKQLIPYCVITRGGSILVVRRRKQGTEDRLHGLLSIGIGGHIGPEDGGPGDPNLIQSGLLRELHEELVISACTPCTPRLAGLLNDDGNPVGQVHVGLVYRLELPAETTSAGTEIVQIREISKLEGEFGPLAEFQDLWQDRDRFETWSQIVVEAMFKSPRQGGYPNATKSVQGNVREE